MALRAHLAALNSTGSDRVSSFKLDEETVTCSINAGQARGSLSISLYERSSYPRTGGLAFAEGSSALESAVEAIGPQLTECAALDVVLKALASQLNTELGDFPACSAAAAAAGSSSSSSAPGPSKDQSFGSKSMAKALDDDDDDAMDDDENEADGSADEEEDASEDEQTAFDYDFERGAELEKSLLRLRHQWETRDQARRDAADAKRVEEEAAAAAAAAAAPAKAHRHKRTADGKVKAPQKQGAHQIFTSAEATRMLCNELFDLMKEEREGFDGVSADCVDFNIHTWRVKVADISSDCKLHADLQALKAKHGYDYIEFELTFTPDMHPFYPCFLKVVRPRFVGVVAEAVMTHPAMTLQGWDPMKRVKWLIRCAQAFLERHGRVDVDDVRNDMTAHPEGAYTSADWAICRLELLAQVTPVWAESETELIASRSAEVDLNRIRELNYGKKEKKEDGAGKGKSGKSGGGWESGVGYGNSATEGSAQWDIAATEKAQAQVDVEMREMIERVTEFTRRGELVEGTIRQSCLRPLLWRQIATASLLDVGSRPERTSMYTQMLTLVRAIAAWPALRPALAEPTGPPAAAGQPPPSVVTALEAMQKQAEFFERTTAKSANDTDVELVATRQLATTILATCKELEGCTPAVAQTPKPEEAAASAVGGRGRSAAAAAEVTPPQVTPRTTRGSAAAAAAAGGGEQPEADKAKKEAGAKKEKPSKGKKAAASEASSSSSVAAASDAAYELAMRESSFDACDELAGHHYQTRSEGKEAASSQLAARTKRISLEAADMMGGGLPVSTSSSIWARMCEGQMQLWRAMISGPEGTPYSAGLFIFDILCPADYPNVAPKVNLQTTGGGSVRFNPNLYNCGKVCLSLLGTWQGDQGESWHAKTSTLLQVFMSIQALILVPDPFFNEPGYERTRGTPEGDRQSRAYNETIREATVRFAMIGQINKPSAELKEPILSHFRMRKDAILEQVRGWATDKGNSARHTTSMNSLLAELEKTMDSHL